MKSYSLLTDDSDYEENVDYDKYIKQIDALFESKAYKEFRKYELRKELINFYIESSKYVCENIMHIQNDSLLLYLTEEESKTKDNAFIKWIKDAGAWLKNAWKAIWEAIQRIFSKDARDKVASLETKAKQYDELKTQFEEVKSQRDEFKRQNEESKSQADAYKSVSYNLLTKNENLEKENEEIRSQKNASAAEYENRIGDLEKQNEDLTGQKNTSAANYEKQIGDLKKQNEDLKKQNTQQMLATASDIYNKVSNKASDIYNKVSNKASDIYNKVSNKVATMFTPKQGAQNDTPTAKLNPNATPQSDVLTAKLNPNATPQSGGSAQPAASQPQQTNMQTQNTQQDDKQQWSPLSDTPNAVASMVAPKQDAQQQQSQNPPAASPTQNQDQQNQGQTVQPQQQAASKPQGQVQISALNMITRCYNWLMKIYKRVNISENDSKNLDSEAKASIDACKSSIISQVDHFLDSTLARALYNNKNSNKIINPIFSFLASNGSKPLPQASGTYAYNVTTLNKEFLQAKIAFAESIRTIDEVTKIITNGLKETGYDQIYNVIYKIYIKYILIHYLILIISYFGSMFLTNDTLDEINRNKEVLWGGLNDINYYYSKLAIDSNYIYNYSKIIELSSNYVDTAEEKFCKIFIVCTAKACETLSSPSIDENELDKVYGNSGCIATMKNLINDIGFNPNLNLLSDSLSMKINESLNASRKNGVVNINNLQKNYTNNINVLNQLWNEISMIIEGRSKVNFYDGLKSSMNKASSSFNKIGEAIMGGGKQMMDKGKEAISGILTAINKKSTSLGEKS